LTGFTTDYVNQIATNLRDRYRTGFPILKELVQNADDAGARALAFGYHPGHADDADHMLLKGPALWVLNDGMFKPSDQRAIRSFGLNAKAGDSDAIGKFGLGMKSVFHLCESFFYVASHQGMAFRDFLNPWRNEDGDCSDMHQQWETVTDRDWDCLDTVARAQPEVANGRDWFLLWIPLRQHSHVPRSGDRRTSAIIDRYPGANATEDLDFFSDHNIDQRIGTLLPLLRNLDQVRFAGSEMRESFTVALESKPSGQRLDHKTDHVRISGTIKDDRPRSERMHFLVHQRVPGNLPQFQALRAAKSWPTSMAITESGTRESTPDKAAAEAAVMFAHADKRAGRLELQWAVFLPAEEQRFSYAVWIPGSAREYRIILHGQFFVDAGRRGIADMETLDRDLETLPVNPSQHLVQEQWNQALAQQVVLPEFLPALSEYVKSVALKDAEIAALTTAITQCAAKGDAASSIKFFATFGSFICKRFAWIRRLSVAGASWELVEPSKKPILPLPEPPLADTERPWRALPGLFALKDYVFADTSAPSLAIGYAAWEPKLLLCALQGITPNTLKSGTDLDYLASFLQMEASKYVQTEDVQDTLVAMLRGCLKDVGLAEVRQNRKDFKRLVQCLSPERVFIFGPQDAAAKGAIPEALYRTLLNAATKALPVPGDLGPNGVTPVANDADLGAWLDALIRHDFTGVRSGGVSKAQVLDAADRVIRAAGDESRQLSLLRQNSLLKVLRASKGADGEVEGVSLTDLLETHARGWLFRVSDARQPLGHVPRLASALPEVQSFVVGALVASYVVAFSDKSAPVIPSSLDADALLRSAGVQSMPPLLGNHTQRGSFLTLVATAKLEDSTVIRGVRYLLHGSADHYMSDEVLWKDPVGQRSPWVRLWRMVDESPWRVLSDNLCGSIPDNCARVLGIKAVDETSVLGRLRSCIDFSGVDANQFTMEEIDLILARVTEEHPWKRLPLHRAFGGAFAAVQGSSYLGRDPELPDGLEHSIQFVEPSLDPDHLRQQHRILQHWDAITAATIVLNSAYPARHWHYLMDLLGRYGSLAERPPQKWSETPWLPLASGGLIALNSLIRLENLNADIRNLARRCEYAYAGPEDLTADLRAHSSFPILLGQISTGEGALPVLGQMMLEAGLSIGRCAGIDYHSLKDCMTTLVAIESLPAWVILERATVATSPDAVERHLIPEVAKQLAFTVCQSTLTELSALGSGEPVCKVLIAYLREWRASALVPELREGLAGLRLLSAAGIWVPAAELVAGVSGVMPEFAVNERLLASLNGVAIDNRSTPDFESTEGLRAESDGTPEELLQALETFFEPLISSSVKPAAGAVIGLFGQRVASLSKSWLEPIAYEDYLAKLGWCDPGREDGFDRRIKWMGGKTLADALSTLTIHIEVQSGKHLIAKSLTGAPVKVQFAPADKIDTLFVMTDRWHEYSCRVHLRPAAVLIDREPQKQRDILMRTAESLLKDLYNQQHANLSELFSFTDKADQVTLDVARTLILEGLPQSLRSLPGTRKNEKLAHALAQLDEARRSAASAKGAGRSSVGRPASLEKALSNLASLVELDEEVQAVVLAGIKARVTHNQYEVASIPFELFQNADDAVVEMQNLQRADGRHEFDAEAIGRFVMQPSDKTIRFAHWGRPINYAGRLSSHNAEFANDLERMLMLGASAKDENEGVTGKFGLGFKSVLLASNTPRIWSGDLCFEVVAGCLPRKWTASAATKRFKQDAQTSSQRPLRQTLIELPIDSKGSVSALAERFVGLAGLLPVFAKRLRRVVIGNEHHTWQPRLCRLKHDRYIETGSVSLPVKAGWIHSQILVFRIRSGCVVLRIGASGIENFDREAQTAVPAIWVTAPTRGTPARGVLVNAAFEIDTGRATLASGKSAIELNTTLAKTLANEVSPLMIDLHTKSEAHWTQLSGELGCSELDSSAAFWFGLWEKLLAEAPEQDPAVDVLLLDRFACSVFRNVVQQTGRVPNGLRGKGAALVDIQGLCLSVKLPYLANVLPALLGWHLFVDKYPIDGWCVEQIRDWLRRSGLAEEDDIPSLDLAHVLASLEFGHLPHTEIENLAEVLRAWPSNLNEAFVWRAAMTAILLRSRAGNWTLGRALIRGHDLEQQLLSRFAPERAVLHPDYDANSSAFRTVEQYLPAWHRDLPMLVGWCIGADSDDSQAAAVAWLARNIYDPIIDELRARRTQGGWLFSLTTESPALAGLSTEERRLLLTKLGLFDNYPPLNVPASLNLNAIHGWWSENGRKWVIEFDNKLWPTGFNKDALRNDEPYDRAAWMTLFSLGVFRRYGRVKDDQHRGFLNFLSSKGWWRTICEVHPDGSAEAWMEILRAYAEGQQTDTLFELWMDSFPRLYRIARWLDTYVHLFQTLDRRDSKLAKFLLSPALDPSLSGSGIEAPTLSGMLRLGQHLVVRELLRVNVLSSVVARELAFAPRSAVLDLMASLGHEHLLSSGDIYRVLVLELGEERACFSGAYDIPLQLIAINDTARHEVELWAARQASSESEEDLEQSELP
jgi:hypothetical protein